MYYPDADETIADYDLPELPEWDDGPAELVLFRQGQENVWLGDGYTLEDVQEYCEREDTHGPGWFVGYRVEQTPEQKAERAERDITLLNAARTIDRLISGG